MIGRVGGPGGSDFGRLPISSSGANARRPTKMARKVVEDNMTSDFLLIRAPNLETIALESGAASCRLYRAAPEDNVTCLTGGG
jgi:hypothetical protein